MEHITSINNLCKQLLLLFLLLLSLIQSSYGQAYKDDTFLSEVKYHYNTTNISSVKYEYDYFYSMDSYNAYKIYGNHFKPTLVMLPPKSWSDLCGTAIPNTTKEEIQNFYSNKTGLNLANYEKKDVWLFLNEKLSSRYLNNSCSTKEKMINVERLNTYVYKYNEGYEYDQITNLILMGDLDLFPGSSVSYIDLIVVDQDVAIENSILQEQNISGVSAHYLGAESYNWSFYMAVTDDMNFDSKITLDDYNLYLIIEESTYIGNVTPVYPDCVGNCDADGSSMTTTIFKVIISMLVLFCFTLFCIQAKKHSDRREMMQTRQELNTVRQGLHQNTHSNNNNNNNNNNSVSLTENDFASLPQMIYHAKTNLTLTNINEEVTIVDCDAVMDEISRENEVRDSSSNNNNNKNIELALEEISDSTGTSTTSTANQQQQQSLSFFRKTYGVSLKAIECCSICLEEFTEDEVVTALPRCCHLFHTACIGQWLLERKSNQCPMCKCSVLKLQQEE